MIQATRSIIIGGSTADVYVPDVERLPPFGGDEFTTENLEMLGAPPTLRLGGNGAICAAVLANLGEPTTLYTNLGDDAWGLWVRGNLEPRGVRVVSLMSGLRTSVHVSLVDGELRRMSLFYPGTTLVPGADDLVDASVALVGGCPHPAVDELEDLLGKLRGATTLLDIGPDLGQGFLRKRFRGILSQLDILIANEAEMLAFTGLDPLAGAREVARETRAGVVLKRGPQGAVRFDRQGVATEAPACRVTPKNTIGAGDAFNGGMVYGLCRGWDWPDILPFANAVAARVVETDVGADAVPRAEELLEGRGEEP